MLTNIILIFIFLVNIVPSVHAQDLSTQLQDNIISAEADYRYQFDQYRSAYLNYQTSKSNWSSNPTLVNQQNALTAAINVATFRAETLLSYSRWIRLQILQYNSAYEQANSAIGLLEGQEKWLNEHKSSLSGIQSITRFDEVMEEYASHFTSQEQLYATAQVQLKLARIATYQHTIRSLYDPLLSKLETNQNDLVVIQGLEKIQNLGNEVNEAIVRINQTSGSLEAESFNPESYYRRINEDLIKLQANQQSMLNAMIELEQKYAK